MNEGQILLLVGEVYVDFTIPKTGGDSKLRLGGIVHAARGLWAIGANYAVAAVCPRYLVDQTRNFLQRYGCSEFIWLADVNGAPNVMAIGDPFELADQEYQEILREEKIVEYNPKLEIIKKFEYCLIFPGKYDLTILKELLNEGVRVSFDIAYDVANIGIIDIYRGNIVAIIT